MAQDESAEAIEVRLVLEAIYARYGYDFRGYAPESITRRVKTALARSGSPHLGELQHRLLREPALFASIADLLTVQVSEMFRDPTFYRVFRQRVVPLLRTYPQLKVWHAGCASGEEVYTTAILLLEEDLYQRTQIYATDVSENALQQAKEGIYPESQAQSFASCYLEAGGKRRFDDYCSRAYGRIAMHEALRKNVVFFQHDLVSDYALGEMNVILCRNVLIYFGSALRGRVLGLFERGLCRGGFLCLGRSEGLQATKDDAFEAFDAVERIYRHRGSHDGIR